MKKAACLNIIARNVTSSTVEVAKQSYEDLVKQNPFRTMLTTSTLFKADIRQKGMQLHVLFPYSYALRRI